MGRGLLREGPGVHLVEFAANVTIKMQPLTKFHIAS